MDTQKTHDVHKVLFFDIVGLLRKYDSVFDKHIVSGQKNCLYSSNRIQNKLTLSTNQVIKIQLKHITKDGKVDLGHCKQYLLYFKF